jgi:3-oxoacyl-(acyl-carrier-protein) synthase
MERVFITDMGAQFCNGRNVTEFSQNLFALRSGLQSGFSPQNIVGVAGLIDVDSELDFACMKTGGLRRWGFTERALQEVTKNLDKAEYESCGLYFGCDTGPTDEQVLRVLQSPFFSFKDNNFHVNLEEILKSGADSDYFGQSSKPDYFQFLEYSSPAFLLEKMRHHLQLPGNTRIYNSLCISSLQACGEAFLALRRGQEAVAVCGGAENFSYQQALSFIILKAYSQLNDEQKASRPFDLQRSGVVLGEGAGLLLLETESALKKSGSVPLCEVLAYGINNNALHMTRPMEDGDGFLHCMGECLQKAGLQPDDIDLVVAHGTGTYHNDRAEAEAIRNLFSGLEKPWVQSIKSFIGHTLSVAGVANLIAGILQMQKDFVLPTLFLENIDPACELRHPPVGGTGTKIRHILINASAFGGFNASMILRG